MYLFVRLAKHPRLRGDNRVHVQVVLLGSIPLSLVAGLL